MVDKQRGGGGGGTDVAQSKIQVSSSLLAAVSSPPKTNSLFPVRVIMAAKSRLHGHCSSGWGDCSAPCMSSHSQLSCMGGGSTM
jgi:hypothetical protein